MLIATPTKKYRCE